MIVQRAASTTWPSAVDSKAITSTTTRSTGGSTGCAEVTTTPLSCAARDVASARVTPTESRSAQRAVSLGTTLAVPPRQDIPRIEIVGKQDPLDLNDGQCRLYCRSGLRRAGGTENIFLLGRSCAAGQGDSEKNTEQEPSDRIGTASRFLIGGLSPKEAHSDCARSSTQSRARSPRRSRCRGWRPRDCRAIAIVAARAPFNDARRASAWRAARSAELSVRLSSALRGPT